MQEQSTIDDVKDLLRKIENLKKDIKAGTLSDQETRSRLEEVEAVAKQLAIRVGLKT